MKEVIIVASNFDTSYDVHNYLAQELSFPHYYGHNFAALQDCLEDIDTPTHIILDMRTPERVLSNVDMDSDPTKFNSLVPWFNRLSTVIGRAAKENPALTLTILQ